MALTRTSRLRRLSSATAVLVALAVLAPQPAFAQEEGPDSPDTTQQPGYSSLNVAQPRGTRELQNALQRLALNPADIDALIDGGNAALLLGDPQAAIGFFARADEMSPGNGRVKAGLASGLLLNENPYEALRLFDEAKKLGVPESVYAADRGLAYDLVGNSNAAQADYEIALRRGGDDETIRRYALSLGISGDRTAAEAQLDPLLRKRDAAAWRTRAFVLAISGDAQGAIAIADATMPKRMAASIEPFFRYMGRLTPAQQAAAAHFGQFPQSAAIGKDDPRNRQYASIGTPRPRSGRADSGLIPAGEPLGPAAESTSRRVAKVDKSSRRRPGRLSKKEREAIALAQAQAAAQPVTVEARTPGPVPPSDLLIPGRGVAPATVQPLPTQVQSARATVQPLPGQTQPARATVQALPGQTQSAQATVQALPEQTRNPRQTQVARSTASNPPATPPVVMSSVRESVRQPNIPAASAAKNANPPASDSKPVEVARADNQARPGFISLASNSALAPTPSAPAPAAPDQAQQLPPVTSTAMARPNAPGSAGASAASGAGTGATGFDLARIGSPAAASPSAPSSGSASASATPPPAAEGATGAATQVASAGAASGTVQPVPPPARVSLSSVIASITVPPQELALDENAVDITKLKPAPPKVDPKVAEAKKLEAKKAEEKKAAAKKAAAKPAPPKHPKRYWVQVAGGANRADLAKEWKRLTGEAPAVFKGKQGWWTPLNATNRLLAGPFSGPNEAQTFVNTLAKSKLSGFAFTSPEGQEVTKIGG